MYKNFTDPQICEKIKNNEKVSCALFLARLQPIHKAHIYMIEKALSECDALLILLGSANKKGTLRNPFDSEIRLKLLEDSLKGIKGYDRIAIDLLPDWAGETHSSTFGLWGHYLYYNFVSRTNQKDMVMYYCDEKEKVSDWFDDEVKDRVHMRFLERENIYEGLSSTKIRESLEDPEKNEEYLVKYLPDAVYKERYALSEIWKKVLSDPENDFNPE